jgi:hypothetical protein
MYFFSMKFPCNDFLLGKVEFAMKGTQRAKNFAVHYTTIAKKTDDKNHEV